MNKREFIKKSICGAGAFCFHYRAMEAMNMFGSNNLLLYTDPVTDEREHTREAYHYISTPRGAKCLICPNECTITTGESGDCRNRVNINEKIHTIAYGNPCAIHVDPIEKKPLYHFMPSTKTFSIATAGCNLACLNCQNYSISQKSPKETKNYKLMPETVLENAIKNNCASIAYTYSEPITFYEYTFDTSKLAKSQNIKNVMVTAGYINQKPLQQLCEVIDAANVDLKSFSDEIYLKLSAGKLEPVLNTLKTFKDQGVWLEITNLIVPGWTDNFDMIKKMCNWLVTNGFENTPLHFSRFYPQYKLTQLPPTPAATLQKARSIAIAEGLNYVYIGNLPGMGAENTSCPSCGSIVVERKGYSILKNSISDGKCENCHHMIHGVWEKV